MKINKVKIKQIIRILLLLFSKFNNAQTWEKINPIFPERDTLFSSSTINFVNKNIGWIITSGTTQLGNSIVKLFESNNGGLNWQLKINSESPLHYSTFSLDTNHTWFISLVGTLVFTKDMGISWDTSSVTFENLSTSGGFFTSLFFLTI